jgi:MEDS: MEthanogen/methylotroph, DcmR Sensory domain
VESPVSSLPQFNDPQSQIFWGEIAPCEHLAQFYEHDGVLIDTLTGFIGGGLEKGESTIVIATPAHLRSLEQALLRSNVDLTRALIEDRYIALDAETTLARFMVGNWPDDQLFAELVGSLIRRATKNDRRVRAFGEMVALLWARGDSAATVRLEHLWNQVCLSRSFSLFCAYPKAGFTKDPQESLAAICAAHSRVI